MEESLNTLFENLNYNEVDYAIKNKDKKNIKYVLCSYIQDDLKSEFIVYENSEETLIGIDPKFSFTLQSNNLKVTHGDQIILSNNNKLSENFAYLSNELSNIKTVSIYGKINFSLAYEIYNIKNCNEPENLTSFFIPSTEISIRNNIVKVRYLDNNPFKNIDFQNFNFETVKFNDNLNENLLLQGETEYKNIVRNAIEDIKNYYYSKIILSRKVNIPKPINIIKSYFLGSEQNSPARSFLFNFDKLSGYGFSPETILEVDMNRNISTFPLAGTRKYESGEQGVYLKNELTKDLKEIAEHAVSVKLAFSELLEICEKNSVQVNSFMNVYQRGPVQHLGSLLSGKLLKDKNYLDAIYSLFPAVTASGIPKRESLLAIEEYETAPRDLYSGGIFIFNKTHGIDIALVLRTVFQNEKETYIRAGAGIIESSSAEREFEETCEKLNSVVKSIVF